MTQHQPRLHSEQGAASDLLVHAIRGGDAADSPMRVGGYVVLEPTELPPGPSHGLSVQELKTHVRVARGRVRTQLARDAARCQDMPTLREMAAADYFTVQSGADLEADPDDWLFSSSEIPTVAALADVVTFADQLATENDGTHLSAGSHVFASDEFKDFFDETVRAFVASVRQLVTRMLERPEADPERSVVYFAGPSRFAGTLAALGGAACALDMPHTLNFILDQTQGVTNPLLHPRILGGRRFDLLEFDGQMGRAQLPLAACAYQYGSLACLEVLREGKRILAPTDLPCHADIVVQPLAQGDVLLRTDAGLLSLLNAGVLGMSPTMFNEFVGEWMASRKSKALGGADDEGWPAAWRTLLVNSLNSGTGQNMPRVETMLRFGVHRLDQEIGRVFARKAVHEKEFDLLAQYRKDLDWTTNTLTPDGQPETHLLQVAAKAWHHTDAPSRVDDFLCAMIDWTEEAGVLEDLFMYRCPAAYIDRGRSIPMVMARVGLFVPMMKLLDKGFDLNRPDREYPSFLAALEAEAGTTGATAGHCQQALHIVKAWQARQVAMGLLSDIAHDAAPGFRPGS